MPDKKKPKKPKQEQSSKATPDDPDQLRLKRIFPEFARLPPGWVIKYCKAKGKDENRVYYSKEGEDHTWAHPALGALPPGYEVRMFQQEGTGLLEPRFSIIKNGKRMSSLKDPRLRPDVLKAAQKSLTLYHGSEHPGERSGTQIAGSIIKMNKNKKLSDMRRAAVAEEDISNSYDYLHCIDTGLSGDNQGGIGGMNGGVFVVKLKQTNRLFVEKRFRMGKEGDDDLAINELSLMHRVKHSALTFFSNGFVTDSLSAVYMEFCDRGSLGDIMKAYKYKRRQAPPDEKPRVPEKFLWHCFVGLCDGLAYLRTGLYYVNSNIQSPDKIKPGWIPILHRDIKPDNILLKSRMTSANRKYFYCTLSDFGLACEEYPDGDARQDYTQKSGGAAGTPYWFAPELCHDPYPMTENQARKFAGGFRHSQRTDLWALGTIIYNLAECDSGAHIDWAQEKAYNMPSATSKFHPTSIAKVMHVEPKTIKLYYSDQLRQCIKDATNPDPNKRPKPTEMIIKLSKKAKQAIPGDPDPQNEEERLPEWATSVHEYHARKPKTKQEAIDEKLAKIAAKNAAMKQQ